MQRRTKGILAAAFFIILFVILPRLVLSQLPPELFRMLSMTGVDLEATLLSLIVPGVALAILALIGSFANRISIISLVAAIFSQLVWFHLFLFLIGLGQPWNFGLARIAGGGGPAAITLLLDSRLFVVAAAVILSLKIVKMSLEHLSLRRVPATE